MSDTSDAVATDRPSSPSSAALPRAIADAYVDALADLDPITGQYLGLNPGDDRLPDFSPAGLEALAGLSRRTLAELDAAEAAAGELDAAEPRCATGSVTSTPRRWPTRPTRWAASGTHCGSASGTAPSSTWTRRTPGAGRSSCGSTRRCVPRPRRCSRARRRFRRWPTWRRRA